MRIVILTHRAVQTAIVIASLALASTVPASTSECATLRGALAIQAMTDKVPYDPYAEMYAANAVDQAIVSVQAAIREGRLSMTDEATAIATALSLLAINISELVPLVVEWGNEHRNHDVTTSVGNAERMLSHATSRIYLLSACDERE